MMQRRSVSLWDLPTWKITKIIRQKSIGLYRDGWFDHLRKDNCYFP